MAQAWTTWGTEGNMEGTLTPVAAGLLSSRGDWRGRTSTAWEPQPVLGLRASGDLTTAGSARAVYDGGDFAHQMCWFTDEAYPGPLGGAAGMGQLEH